MASVRWLGSIMVGPYNANGAEGTRAYSLSACPMPRLPFTTSPPPPLYSCQFPASSAITYFPSPSAPSEHVGISFCVSSVAAVLAV